MKESDYIGFYSLHDEPHRIFENDAGEVCAERYKPGTGFVPTSISEVMWRGRSISEQAFKKLVLDSMGQGS